MIGIVSPGAMGAALGRSSALLAPPSPQAARSLPPRWGRAKYLHVRTGDREGFRRDLDIDIQDLEHHATVDTRVSNKGVRVEPRINSDDERDLEKEEEDALLALEHVDPIG